jgi:hypothetical protein
MDRVALASIVTVVAISAVLIFGDFTIRVAGGALAPLGLFTLYRATLRQGRSLGFRDAANYLDPPPDHQPSGEDDRQ